MDSEIKVEVIQEETIRPSSPTPQHLKVSNLSVFDQLVPPIYIPLLLFYPNNNDSNASNTDHHSLVAEKSRILKKSLSEALTQFNPLAGQFQYNDSIHCNDRGAAFLTAQVNCPISKILDEPDLVMLVKLLPSDQAGHLLKIQANFFECGGFAIGVYVSHKAADASTLSKFINRWSEIALGSGSSTSTDHVPVKFGAAASVFPPLDSLNSPPKPSTTATSSVVVEKCITRRFVFDGSNLSALKSRAANATVPNPTRVEVASALIWKCAEEAARSNLGIVTARPSAWCQTVNLRKIITWPLEGEDLLGNVVGLVAAKIEEISEADDLDLQSLVARLKKGIDEMKQKYRNGVSGEDLCQDFMETVNLIMSNDIARYSCTSWCRFSFYRSNFGWGNPAWISTPSVDSKNTIVMLDTSDGDGLQAFITLKEEDMAKFVNNKDLLEYASLNPSVV